MIDIMSKVNIIFRIMNGDIWYGINIGASSCYINKIRPDVNEIRSDFNGIPCVTWGTQRWIGKQKH